MTGLSKVTTEDVGHGKRLRGYERKKRKGGPEGEEVVRGGGTITSRIMSRSWGGESKYGWKISKKTKGQ